jgi:tetratricopeptide (TPR) repeat protein
MHMEIRTMGISRMALLVGVTLAVACGGGGGGSGEGARDARGNVIRTAGGTEVTQEAHNRWTAAVEKFKQFDAAPPWTEAKCNEAIGAFESAVEAQGGRFAEALYMAGLVAQRCNDRERARGFYNRALEANQKYCKARAAIGTLQLDEGQVQAAEQTFRRALTDDTRCTEAYVNVAVIQRGRGGAEVREALNNLRRALAIEAQYLPAFNQMALLYLDLAQGQENPQMLDLAAVVCRQAQLIDRDYAPIYNTWGLVNLRKQQVIEALQMFERAVRLDNDMFEAHMNFGQITLSFRGYEDAKTSFQRAVELQPNDYDAHIGLGVALRGLRQLPQAQAEYERAIQIDGNRPDAYFNLGLLYQDYMSGSVEDLRRAKTFYEQFLAKAGRGERYASTVEEVTRRCRQQQQGRRQRRRSTDCRNGRIQNIETAIEALSAAAEVQRQMEQQQRQQGGQGGGG